MIERDYIMRILQEFFAALAKVVRQKEEDNNTADIQERFDAMYRQFFHASPDSFYYANNEIILADILEESDSDGDAEARMQMLSELLYQDALIKKDLQLRYVLLDKALYLLMYLENTSRTFSWERGQKIADITKMRNEFTVG